MERRSQQTYLQGTSAPDAAVHSDRRRMPPLLRPCQSARTTAIVGYGWSFVHNVKLIGNKMYHRMVKNTVEDKTMIRLPPSHSLLPLTFSFILSA